MTFHSPDPKILPDTVGYTVYKYYVKNYTVLTYHILSY